MQRIQRHSLVPRPTPARPLTRPRALVIASLVLVVGLSGPGSAQEPQAASAQGAVEFPVWPDVAPGSERWTRSELDSGAGGGRRVRNVVRPSLTPFVPKAGAGNGTAVVIAPGGAFRFLSWESEGTKVAEWLCERGVAAFVLKYRLVDTGSTDDSFRASMSELARSSREPGGPFEHPETKEVAELAAEDGRQAIRILRAQSAKWGLAPDRIGIIGFSAGAVVATRVGVAHDAACRPNFVAAVYGAPMRDYAVPPDAPPLFVLFAEDDGIRVEATELHEKWKGAAGSSELVTFERGGHGFGMSRRGQPTDEWIDRFGGWLAAQGFFGAPAERGAATGEALVRLSERKWRWMAERSMDELKGLFHEQAVFVHMGGTMTRQEELDTIESGRIVYKHAEIQDVSTRVIDTTAIVLSTIRLLAIVGGNEVTNPFVVTEVYVKQGEAWKLASLSFTRTMGR